MNAEVRGEGRGGTVTNVKKELAHRSSTNVKLGEQSGEIYSVSPRMNSQEGKVEQRRGLGVGGLSACGELEKKWGDATEKKG